MDKFREEQIEESRFLFPRYNLSLSTYITNMNILSSMVLEISLTKSVTELRKDGWTQARTEGRTEVNQYTPTFLKQGHKY